MRLKEASIMVVDDEPILLDLMGEWFQRIACQVFCAADGVKALEILVARKIDLIITDVRMPVMDGITLLKKIKAGGSQSPGVVLITGFADIQSRDAYDLGAAALLEKPIEFNHLISAIERELLEPNERWRKPRDLSACPVLRRTFASMTTAIQDHRIAFGRGGFCLEADQFLVEGPVDIELRFRTDGYVLSGQGIARWLAHQENQVGIELTYLAEASRARVIALTEAAVSFIPRKTGRQWQALAS